MTRKPALFRLVKMLPRCLLSRITGMLVRLRLPGPLMRPVLRYFVRRASIDMTEAQEPLAHYRTIEEVFTRRLRPGARPISGAVSAPSDGMLTLSQDVDGGCLLQAKGLTYSVNELLTGCSSRSPRDEPSRALTIYLSPRDYHRVHAPLAGRVTDITYLPGDLWPVNNTFVSLVPRLFVRNERLVLRMELNGGGAVYVVMVGALNVGRMATPFMPDFVTNSSRWSKPSSITLDAPVEQGDELGMFMLGSTVVMVFNREAAARFAFTTTERRLRAGEAIASQR